MGEEVVQAVDEEVFEPREELVVGLVDSRYPAVIVVGDGSRGNYIREQSANSEGERGSVERG